MLIYGYTIRVCIDNTYASCITMNVYLHSIFLLFLSVIITQDQSQAVPRRKRTVYKWYDTCGRNKYGQIRETSIDLTTQSVQPNPANKIIGGIAAREGEIPWQIAIKRDGAHVCGGALIDELHVITAAHCLKCNPNVPSCELDGEYTVMLGAINLLAPNENTREVNILMVTIHPNYKGSTSNEYDLAILRLSMSLQHDIQDNIDIGTVCPPQTDINYNGLKCVMSGWGKMGYPVGPKPESLYHVSLDAISRESCCGYHCAGSCSNNHCNIYDYNLCAGYPQGGSDACTGDSGGPLVCKVDEHYELVGVNSWGEGCGEENLPGVYMGIVPFLDWIDSVINPALQ